MLTGRTSDFDIPNRRLSRIVKKCTAFAPSNRYRSVAQVKRALLNMDAHVEKAAASVCAAAVLALGLCAAGFAAGRFTDIRPALFYNVRSAYFADPVIEQAVRMQLGKQDEEPIRTEELGDVTELYIYGDQFAQTMDDFYNLRNGIDSGEIVRGTEVVDSLEDLSQLSGLKTLCLGYANMKDLSALSAMSGLRSLELLHCTVYDISTIGDLEGLNHLILQTCENVTDLSRLTGCESLTELVLTDNSSVQDYSVLSSLDDFDYLHLEGVRPSLFLSYLNGKSIRQLKIGWGSISSVSDLAGIQGLEELIMNGIEVNTLDGVEQLDSLTSLTLHSMEWLDLSPLLNAPRLRTLTLSADMQPAAEAALGNASFTIQYE